MQRWNTTPYFMCASVKSRLVLHFWYRLTQAVPEKGPLNARVCVCVKIPADPGSPGKRAVRRVWVCVCVCYWPCRCRLATWAWWTLHTSTWWVSSRKPATLLCWRSYTPSRRISTPPPPVCITTGADPSAPFSFFHLCSPTALAGKVMRSIVFVCPFVSALASFWTDIWPRLWHEYEATGRSPPAIESQGREFWKSVKILQNRAYGHWFGVQYLAHPAWLACWCRFVVGAELLRGGENYQNYMVTVGARRSGRAWLDFILFSQAFLLCQCVLNKKLIGWASI